MELLVFLLFIGAMFVGWRRFRRLAKFNELKEALAAHGMAPTHVLLGQHQSPSLVIDPTNRKFAFYRTGNDVEVYDFVELVSAEIVRNGHAIHDTSQIAGGAFVGGLLLGPAGMLLGAASAKSKTRKEVLRLSLKVYVSDFGRPVHELVFFDSKKGQREDAVVVRQAVADIDQWYGRLQTVLRVASSPDATHAKKHNPDGPSDVRDDLQQAPSGSPSSSTPENFEAPIQHSESKAFAGARQIVTSVLLYAVALFLAFLALVGLMVKSPAMAAGMITAAGLTAPISSRLLWGRLNLPSKRRWSAIVLMAFGSFVWGIADQPPRSNGLAHGPAALIEQTLDTDQPAGVMPSALELRATNERAIERDNLPREQPATKIRDLWVTSDRLNRRTCPTESCGVVGKLFFREIAKVQEERNGFGRITKYYDAACRDGVSVYVDDGNSRCTADNGITDGLVAEWVSLEFLSATRPPDPAASAVGIEKLVAQSDDYRLFGAIFVKAAQELIGSGQCSQADFIEQGGWLKSSNSPDDPVYFTYCGGTKIANRIHLNAATERIYR